ncbi:aspartic peptidase domain-containing protein [Lophiotrema nucula]|uniref:Aspartic peptidase domain-containing protein n=1 Tax=Lophiotrema nucula TaxID=690887 RepID=A0A6A5ZEC1_9PLEO|nr:aspartic peptidase domain-containing protein [Lophiotrema nucula]
MVAVKFGESTEEYHLLLDSAASNTWVMSEKCTTDACSTHNSFGNGDSSTLKTEDTTFSITYGTGSVSGTLGTDDVHISSISTSLTFGLASNVSDEFSSYPMDGILGIGRGDNSDGTIKAPTLMDALSSSGSIKSKIFAIHLSRTADGLNDGELNLGELNKDRYDGDINYIPTVANENGFWEIPVDDAGIEGTLLGLKGRSAILDSGTSFILMPEPDGVALHKLIDGSKQSGETFTVPCSTTTPIQISFNGQSYNVSTADYIGGKMDDGSCKSNIIGRQTFGESQWLVGDVFLKNVYSVFDFDSSQVGFGVKSGGKQESVSSANPSGTATPVASSGEQSSPTPISTPSSSPSVTGASSAAVSSGSSADLAPTGGSPTAQQTVSASGTAQQSAAGAKASATGGSGRATSSSFAFSIALGLLPLFIESFYRAGNTCSAF